MLKEIFVNLSFTTLIFKTEESQETDEPDRTEEPEETDHEELKMKQGEEAEDAQAKRHSNAFKCIQKLIVFPFLNMIT